MALQFENVREHFFLWAGVFLILFTFSGGIGLAATNQLATGLPLLLSCVITLVLAILAVVLKWVEFPRPAAQQSSESRTVSV